MNELRFLRRGVLALPIGAAAPAALAQAPTTVDEAEATRIGTEAYVFGYPLITTFMTRRVMTNVERPEGIRAPVSQFANVRECRRRGVSSS